VAALDPFPQSGEVFLGFELLSELGRGGMGRVFLARQQALSDRLVVLKVGRHLTRECQKLAKLQHPNIVPVYSFHQSGTVQILCMPYRGPLTLAHLVARLRTEDLQTFDGKALTTIIEECRRGREPSVTPDTPLLPRTKTHAVRPADHPSVQARDRAKRMFNGLRGLNYIDAVLTIIRQVTDGLRFAHAERIVHCDLKPANVLISDDGCPQLIDFGIAYDKSNFAAGQLQVGGTRPYMSPEQLTSFVSERLEYDERSDLYGVGVMLYELVTGELPFEPNFVSTPAAIESDCMNRFKPPPRPRSINPKVPRAVEAIIQKCLAPRVADRYQSALELREDLDRQLARQPLKYAPNPSRRELAMKWVTRNRSVMVAAGVAAVIGFTATGFAQQDARREQMMRARIKANAEEVLKWQAVSAAEPFAADLRDAEFYFGLADTEAGYRDRAWESAKRALNHYQAWDEVRWFDRFEYQALPPERLGAYRRQVAGLTLQLANSCAQQAIRSPGAAARAELLRRAFAWNQRAEVTHPAAESCRAVWLQRAFLTRLAGNPAGAEQFALRADALPRGGEDAFLEGRQLMAEGRLVAAQRVLREAVQADPRNFWATFHLAACAHRLGQDWDAAGAYDICVSHSPGFFGTHYNRAQVRFRMGRAAEAEADFDRAIEARPEWADVYFLRALTREAQQRYAEAVADLNRALELGYTPTSVYLVRSRVHTKLKDKPAADRDLAEGLKIEPTDERGWLARAQARLYTDPAAALGDYDKALELNPRSVSALQGRGHLLSRAGKNREAADALTRLIEINPESADAWSGRGVLHARLNDREAALRDATEALRLSERPATKYQVAGIYATTSRTKADDRREAFALLDAALRAGFGFEYLDKDRELDPIRTDPEFKTTVDAARAYRNTVKRAD
jgi:serine/threonine protein kinase/Tfp pilus assembly protein PilF